MENERKFLIIQSEDEFILLSDHVRLAVKNTDLNFAVKELSAQLEANDQLIRDSGFSASIKNERTQVSLRHFVFRTILASMIVIGVLTASAGCAVVVGIYTLPYVSTTALKHMRSQVSIFARWVETIPDDTKARVHEDLRSLTLSLQPFVDDIRPLFSDPEAKPQASDK